MNEVKLPSGETVYYHYDPRADGLDIRLRPGAEASDPEPLPGVPNVQVRRAKDSGEVVALAASGVQGLILERLVRDLISAAIHPAPAPAPPADLGAEAPEARSPEGETHESPADPPAPGLPLVYDDTGEEGRPRRAGRRRRRRRGAAGGTSAEPMAGEPAAKDQAAVALTGAVTEIPASPSVVEPKPDDRWSVAESETAPRPQTGPVTAMAVGAAPPWPPIELIGTSLTASEAAEAVERAVADDPELELDGQTGDPAGPPAAEVPPAMALSAGQATLTSRRRRRRRRKPPVELPVESPAAAPEADDEILAAVLAPPPGPATAEGLETPPAFHFLGLDERLGQALAALGFQEPTPIQRRAIPPAMAGRDLVGLAQTGTGKTAAFLLPALQRVLGEPRPGKNPRVLVVTPTRELAVQVAEQAVALARFTPLRAVVLYGGAGMGAQISALRRGVDVVVATPGRLLDHVSQRNLRLAEVEVLVLDESDRMLDMGFIPDVRRIISLVPDARQTFLFGATLPPDIEHLSRHFQRDPELVEVARQLPPETLEQALYTVGRHLKLPLLEHLLKSDPALSKVMVFTETKIETDIVARQLLAAGLQVSSMHGDRPQRDRERALEDLKSGRVQVLVATNVAARGLDIEDVTHVVNYDMPQTVDEYVHRIGRTARGAAREGTAYTFVTLSDEGMVRRIESVLERNLPRVLAEGFDYDVPTPSWAQPSAQDLSRSLGKPSLSQVSRSFRHGFGRKRR